MTVCRKRNRSAATRSTGAGLLLVALLLTAGPCGWAQDTAVISGITEPYEDVTLSLTVSGTIVETRFKQGDAVKKGQVILTLDHRLEQLDVERRKLLWQSTAEVEAATARVATLKQQFESTKELFESTGSVSREELDALELEYTLAVAEENRLRMEEDRQKIEYEMALETLEKRILRSPITGILIQYFLKKGESCEPEQPLVQMVDVSKARLVCTVEEPLGRTFKTGQRVDMSIRTGSTTIPKKGTIVFVSPVVDPASGLLELKAEFENADLAVRPGVAGVIRLHSTE
jgi:RND family efflux transporter MFP subunit